MKAFDDEEQEEEVVRKVFFILFEWLSLIQHCIFLHDSLTVTTFVRAKLFECAKSLFLQAQKHKS